MSEFFIKWVKNECRKCQIPDDSKNVLCKLSDKNSDFISSILDYDRVDVIQLVRKHKLLEDTEILDILLKKIPIPQETSFKLRDGREKPNDFLILAFSLLVMYLFYVYVWHKDKNVQAYEKLIIHCMKSAKKLFFKKKDYPN
ncbi:unnamed protein product [Gordionus sp. m RMFG-2023]